MNGLVAKIQSTSAQFYVGALRMVLGYVFLKEGLGKLFGWFGGSGIEPFTGYLTKLGVPFPELNAYMTGGVEAVCGLLLIIGYMTKLACLPIIFVMAVAIFTAHADGSFSYPLMIIAACVALLETGSGRPSVDAYYQCVRSCKIEKK
jgi:putative oxidoreductase